MVREISVFFHPDPSPRPRKYAAVVFVACNRFETNKRKLQYLTFSDFYHCAHSMMELWSTISHPHGHPQLEDMEIETDLDVDRGFLADLRDVRILLDKEKEHKHLVCSQLKVRRNPNSYEPRRPAANANDSKYQQGRLTEKIYADVESSFKTHSRALVAMAGSLNRSRELRSFFVDLVERCVEPLKQARWTSRDLRIFLDYYTPAGVQLLKRCATQSLSPVHNIIQYLFLLLLLLLFGQRFCHGRRLGALHESHRKLFG